MTPQASIRKDPVPPVRIISAGTMKIPLPIMEPAMSMVAEKRPRLGW